MFPARILAALLFTSAVASGQAPGGLRITVTLTDAAQAAAPVARHALLISDNPPTRTPRRLLTAADGTLVVSLAPGSYTVESDRPVAFNGKAYQWTTFVDVVAGKDTALALTAENAEVVAMTTTPSAAGDVRRDADPWMQAGKWQTSVLTIWSPTSRVSGFVVDSRGLLATDRNGVGSASSVEVQLSQSLKVPARVLVGDAAQDVAIVWVDPGVLGQAAPIPLVCPPAAATSLDDGDEVFALTATLHGNGDAATGEITGFHPRGIETDLRLSFGEAGGPVFAGEGGSVVGLTSIRPDTDTNRRGDVLVVRAGVICEALSAARSKMAAAAPPEPAKLPLEPTRAYPIAATTASTQPTGTVIAPPIVSSNEFEVALITPPTVLRAREKADWTGGRSVRTPEAEARLGRLMDFGVWAQYFADVPPVLVVRVTPKLVEGFWMRVAREAARTQGAALPAFKDFKTNFLRLRASCGSAEVAPIHPFVLEHAIGDKRVVREGLYVFGPDAFGPHCKSVSLVLSSEQAPEKSETIVIDPKVIERIWQDFAPYRAAGQ